MTKIEMSFIWYLTITEKEWLRWTECRNNGNENNFIHLVIEFWNIAMPTIPKFKTLTDSFYSRKHRMLRYNSIFQFIGASDFERIYFLRVLTSFVASFLSFHLQHYTHWPFLTSSTPAASFVRCSAYSSWVWLFLFRFFNSILRFCSSLWNSNSSAIPPPVFTSASFFFCAYYSISHFS